MLSHLNYKHTEMLRKFFRHTYHNAPDLHFRNFTTAVQDPDGTFAFCHHNMTNVSLNSIKLEGKYRPSYNNELIATNE